jgi:hypothetical protein
MRVSPAAVVMPFSTNSVCVAAVIDMPTSEMRSDRFRAVTMITPTSETCVPPLGFAAAALACCAHAGDTAKANTIEVMPALAQSPIFTGLPPIEHHLSYSAGKGTILHHNHDRHHSCDVRRGHPLR